MWPTVGQHQPLFVGYLFVGSLAEMFLSFPSPVALVGGAGGTRTPDFRLAKAALSQLSYGPPVLEVGGRRWEVGLQPLASNFRLPGWWAILDSNQGPRSYQDRALTS
jgi:hypothetical protein